MNADSSTLTWLPLMGGLALKSLILFLVAWAALIALRRASAYARHLVCLLTLVALLALPALSFILPVWRLAVLSAPVPPGVPAVVDGGGTGVPIPARKRATLPSEGRDSPVAVAASSSPLRFGEGGEPRTLLGSRAGRGSSPFPWTILLSALWLGGALLALLRPALGLWGIARLSRDSQPVADAPTLTLASECASALGLGHVPAVRQAAVPVPMTWGWRHPVILLPADAPDWPEDRLRAVLLHELAHVRRRDWLSHRFADFVCALYWFHPLVWLTTRRLRAEGEIACDDLVLTSGVAAPDYARHLLDVARALRPAPAVPQAAIAMARTSQIEGRLTMILDTTRPRRALSRRALLLALGLTAAVLVPLAVLRPDAHAQAASPRIQAAMPSVVSPHHEHRKLASVIGTAAAPVFVWAVVPSWISSTAVTIGYVQLAGVANPTTLKWWGVDGTHLPKPVFDLASASHSADVTDPKQRRVLLALRLPPSSQEVTVKYALTGCLYSSSDGTWQSKTQNTSQQTEAHLYAQTSGVRVVTATFPASVSKTNVRVGVADGPWKVIGTARRDAAGQIEGLSLQRVHAGYIFSQLAETKQGTLLTISVNAATGPSPEDLRIVAADGQGREVLPTDIGDNSIGALDQITAHFALPPAQIAAIRLESRPFRYADFKNVALKSKK